MPWNYRLRSLWITTPVPVLILAAVGLALGVRRQLADPRSRAARLLALTEVRLLAPLALQAARTPEREVRLWISAGAAS